MKKLINIIFILSLLTGMVYCQTLTPLARTGDIQDSLVDFKTNVVIPLVEDSLEALEARIADDIDAASMLDLDAGEIYVGNSSNEVSAVAPTGVLSITDAGVTAIVDGTLVDADVSSSTGITATKIGNKDVDNTELSYINGLASNAQTQLTALNGKFNGWGWIPLSFSYPIDDDYLGFYIGMNVTIDSLVCSISDGTTAQINVYHSTVYYENETLASKVFTTDLFVTTQHTTGKESYSGSFGDEVIETSEFIWVKCNDIVGDVSNIFITIYYTQNE